MGKLITTSVRLALANFAAAKGRAFLTILGIVIGIAAVIIVMAIGRSSQELILDQVRSIGATSITVLPGAADDDAPPAAIFGIETKTLTVDDLEAMNNKISVPHNDAAYGLASGSVVAQAGSSVLTVPLSGVSQEYLIVEDIDVASGRYFSSLDDARRNRVVVLGSDAAENLFGRRDPLGEDLSIENKKFTVIGVFPPRGSTLMSSPDKEIFVPLATAQKSVLGLDHLNFVRMRVDQASNIEQTMEDVRVLLRARHNIRSGPDDFSVRSVESAMDVLTDVTNAITYFLVAVAAIALFVGGIGIMNIMVIMMHQRITEIGLRKALGARQRDIFTQFITESVILSFIGGVVGFLLGALIAIIVAFVAQTLGYAWQLIIPLDAAAIAITITFFIGLIFGSYPAYSASKISPMEALRYQ